MNTLIAVARALSGLNASPVFLAAGAVAAYFVGCLSPASVMGRIHGIDVRREGSGNPGTTNVLRTMGKKAAAFTLAVDVLKGFVAVKISYGALFLSTGDAEGAMLYSFICGMAALAGHAWPLPYRFAGGKGVATVLGVIFALEPRVGAIVVAVDIAVLLATRRVSAGSICAAAAFPVVSWFFDPMYAPFALLTAAAVIGKHRGNIGRLLRGEEPKLSFGAKKS
ncbi:MAG: glycerol-3-phosphate 1-O-acyltransferase PlsY [Clostridiales Family XIII bacterium]|jgi:glycerol-3-phosphate acyltransferase PlsY|nr:glycerol-3-phosphate 1-O-acyltransferase PlsY [Clostridiales Family XIII bacterium]